MMYQHDAEPQPQWPSLAIGALRLIVVGGLLCLFDITYSSISRHGSTYDGWRFDFLSDTVGVVLILVGLYRLMKLDVPGTYRSRLTFASVVAWLSLGATVVRHWVFDAPEAWAVTLHILSLARLAAIVLFCSAMVQLGTYLQLATATASFRITRVLFWLLYVAPLAVVEVWIWTDGFGKGADVKLETGWALLVVAVLAIPFVHLFVSASRMKRDLETRLATAGG